MAAGAAVKIRRAGRADEAALVELLAAMAAELGAEVAPDRASITRGVASFIDAPVAADGQERFFLVADAGGGVAGAVSVQRLTSSLAGRPYFLVDDLVVAEAHRRTGVARKLLAEVETLARRAGCPRVELYVRGVNLPALTVVSRAGYRKASDVHLTLALGSKPKG